jgi:hypothetical protein
MQVTPLGSEASATPQPAPTIVVPTATATAVVQYGLLSQLGSGSGRTQGFHLESGKYAIAWEARPLLPSGIGCSLRGSLRTIDGRKVVGTFEGQVVPGENLFSGSQDGYVLPPGDYEIEINSDCAWQVTVLTVRS